MRLVKLAHLKIKEIVSPGDTCLDATAGNGHDALFLASQVSPNGKVYAIDVQKSALSATEDKLANHGYSNLLRTFHGSHSQIDEFIGATEKDNVMAAMFNLGYLPGGDHNLVTTPRTTAIALVKTYELIKPGGIISVLCYRGHKGGTEEHSAVLEICQKKKWQLEKIAGNNCAHSPILILIQKARMD